MMIRQRIYILFLYLLLLSSFPLRASDSFDPESVKRGLKIYHALSSRWVETREEIMEKGVTPFIERLTFCMKEKALVVTAAETLESFITTTFRKTAPDIKTTLHDWADTHQKKYKRSSIFSALNILKADAFFYTLGTRYQSVNAFIDEVLGVCMINASAYEMFYDCCDGVNFDFETLFKTHILSALQKQKTSHLHASILDLLWYEPHQILPNAINICLEEIFEEANQDIKIISILPVASRKNKTTTLQ